MSIRGRISTRTVLNAFSETPHGHQRPALPAFPDSSLPVRESPQHLIVIRSVATLTLLVTLGYLIWRTLFTVELGAWWVSVPLLLFEIHAFVGLALFTVSLWDAQSQPAAQPVTAAPGRVAVLIPTYNESVDVLLPTIAAAVALEPTHETWVLDDGRRMDVAELARSLGARYLTRPDNTHAKAGNINHALAHIDADFIAVVDADHVATPDFLAHTLGYFDDPRIALVQTPQDFYNLDSFEHAEAPEDLSGEHRHLYHEQALFYRVIQPAKNRWDGAFWCGTNAVVRVAALREIGGIATETVTEDIHTTIRLHRRGWKTVYHNEVLARGLAASSADQYILQRYRWGTGAMQVLRTENPLIVSGLSLGQRLSYAKTLLGWFDAWRTLGFLLIPVVVLLTGAVPITASATTFVLLFSITFLMQRVSMRLLSRGYYREHLQMVFELVRMSPNLAATLTLLRPTRPSFQVTPKGRVGNARQRANAPALLYGLLLLSGVAAGWFALNVMGVLTVEYEPSWATYGALFWLTVNACLIASALHRIRSDAFGSERRRGVRFTTELPGLLNGEPCVIHDLSLSGAQVELPVTAAPAGQLVNHVVLTIDPHGMALQLVADIRSVRTAHSHAAMCGLSFAATQYEQRSRLALLLLNGQVTLTSDRHRSATAAAA